MKKIMTMILILCFGTFSVQLFGQQTSTPKNEKKGSFAVGGYDNTRQPEVKKRSIDLDEEVAAPEKAEEAAPAMPPPPAPDQVISAQDNNKDKQKGRDKRKSKTKKK